MDFSFWKEYFISNSSHFGNIDWSQPDHLSQKEIALISRSLQKFQKGEQSEGKHLFSFAKKFSEPGYLETMRLFILEEQTHAAVLGKFMDSKGIPRIKHHWVDSVFRKMRKVADLENSIIVLVTAEIIAKIYYKALRNATNSHLLKDLCNQILSDEFKHVQFQSCTLGFFYSQKSESRILVSRNWRLLLMISTICMVWVHHGAVLKAGSYPFRVFFMETMLAFLETDRQVTPGKSLRLLLG